MSDDVPGQASIQVPAPAPASAQEVAAILDQAIIRYGALGWKLVERMDAGAADMTSADGLEHVYLQVKPDGTLVQLDMGRDGTTVERQEPVPPDAEDMQLRPPSCLNGEEFEQLGFFQRMSYKRLGFPSYRYRFSQRTWYLRSNTISASAIIIILGLGLLFFLLLSALPSWWAQWGAGFP